MGLEGGRKVLATGLVMDTNMIVANLWAGVGFQPDEAMPPKPYCVEDTGKDNSNIVLELDYLLPKNTVIVISPSFPQTASP